MFSRRTPGGQGRRADEYLLGSLLLKPVAFFLSAAAVNGSNAVDERSDVVREREGVGKRPLLCRVAPSDNHPINARQRNVVDRQL